MEESKMEIMNFEVQVLEKFLGVDNCEKVLEAIKRGDGVENIVFNTTNYNQFGKITANRDLIEKHVEELMVSMSSKILPTYVMVDNNLSLADGQHRAEALKRLGKPVAYYLADDLKLEDLATLQDGEAWDKESYLKSNIDLGNENYIFFNDMLKEYDMNPARLLKVFNYAQGVNEDEIDRKFKSGEFKLDKVDKVIDFLAALEDFKPFAKSYYRSGSFMTAFLKLFFRDTYDHEIMKKNLNSKKKFADNLKPCNRYADYLYILTMFIYNKDNTSKKGFIPIFFNKEENKFEFG